MYGKRIGRSERDPFETLVGVLAAATRYDFLLAIVPVAFAVALVVPTVASVSVVETMPVAAIVGALLTSSHGESRGIPPRG